MGRPSQSLAVVLATVSLIAGCGSSTGTTPPASSEVTFASSAPPSLDVAKNYNIAETNIMAMITEPLETLTQDGTYTPLLARSVTQPDKTTIVYDLRPDVTFSNGKPLTAEDVAWSLKHVTGDTAQTKNTLEYVKSIEVTGERQVTVTLSQPDPLTRAALCVVGLIQEKAFAEAHAADLGSANAVPVGTGPYTVDRYTPDEIGMKRNPRYQGSPPAPDRLTFTAITGETKGQLAMRSGRIQGAMISDVTAIKEWERISGAKVYNVPSLQSNFLALDVTRPPFDDVHVRRAVAHALDRPGVLSAAFGSQVRPLRSYLPDDIVRATAPSPAEADAFLAGLPSYPFDLELAKRELEKSAHARGLSFPVYFLDELPWTKLVALNLQENLAKIGVSAEAKQVGRNEWLESIYAKKAGTPTPFNLGTFAPVPNGLDKVVGEGAFNVAKYSTPQTRSALGGLTGDDAERWEATKTLLGRIAEDVPYIPVYQGAQVSVLGGGYTYTRAPSQLDFAQGTNIRLLKAAG
ncbi:ABC transporter substrate-binding protein [Rhizohabitans arisaemae]|uniref:ABC transporter substrate-binding protein n=1 Tax=Rhizohabitans arisaemae TaxID=2720610 RepID=UPI0024B21533|nr:ABC transporter substrate-binding protein [Rhizohabitans arisaemae]